MENPHNLDVELTLDERTREQFDKLKLYWALENLELPTIAPEIHLQKGELCHMCIHEVNWYEVRSSRSRVNYNGYSTSFKVVKGFYLRSGSYSPTSEYTSSLKLITHGNLYLTNKRLIFQGNQKNTTIRLNKILTIIPFSDGVEIGKDTGKSPTLSLPRNADVFSVMLSRILRESY